MAEHERWAALLGSPGTKRKIYLEHAAGQMGLHVLFINWEEWTEPFWDEWIARHGTQGILKIDPPRWDSAELSELPGLMDEYQKRLCYLDELSETAGICFLNHPRDIIGLLDKRMCKSRLSRAGLPVTEEIFGKNLWTETTLSGDLPCVRQRFKGDCVSAGGNGKGLSRESAGGLCIKTAEELLEQMRAHHVHQVFIKPNYGSGALGVAAFRWQPKTGRMMLYTCAAFVPDTNRLVNTKRMQCIDRPQEAMELLDHLLELDCIVERWYAKAAYGGYTYDLRAVMQDGQMDFLLARLSKGPITNLQLNNHPLLTRELGLPDSVFTSVEALCRDAVNLYPGIRSAGMDILLERGSLRPRIIEMNGQGDLIYQDIYHENRIYTHQVQMLAAARNVQAYSLCKTEEFMESMKKNQTAFSRDDGKEHAAGNAAEHGKEAGGQETGTEAEVPLRLFAPSREKKVPSVDMREVVGTKDILFLCLDTLRYDVAVQEEKAGTTPVLNRYGPWEKCQAPGNFTYPSHHAMFAGFLPCRYDAKNVADREMLFFPRQIGLGNKVPKGAYGFSGSTIMEGLEADGYDTWCVGGVAFFDKRSPIGKVFPGYFKKSYWNPSFACPVKDSTKNQIDFILKKLAAAEKEQHIFLYLNVDAIHYPNYFYLEGEKHDSVRTHAAALRYVDQELDRLFEGWKNLRGDAFVICCSDHGTCYGEDDCQFHGINHPIVNTIPYKHFFI